MKPFAYEVPGQGIGSTSFALPMPDATSVMARSLAASTAESITVPTGARFVNFSSTGDFYANANTTATIPGDVTDGSASVLNPGVRSCKGVTTLSVIAPAACIVTAEFYS